jgi:hypothetical protein
MGVVWRVQRGWDGEWINGGGMKSGTRSGARCGTRGDMGSGMASGTTGVKWGVKYVCGGGVCGGMEGM